ncbi:MAG: YgiT-type zinc finger protein [Methanosarcinales archaeon]
MKCGYCGGTLEKKKVSKNIIVNHDAIVLEIEAKVCQRCSTHFYPLESMRKIEKVRARPTDYTQDLTPVGRVFFLKEEVLI